MKQPRIIELQKQKDMLQNVPSQCRSAKTSNRINAEIAAIANERVMTERHKFSGRLLQG